MFTFRYAVVAKSLRPDLIYGVFSYHVKVAQKHPSSIPSLIEAIKLVWIREIPEELCKNLIESMPRRIKAVI